MKDLFKNISNICQKLNDNIIIMFSTGKDATVMLDLFMKNYDKAKLHVVYLEFIKNLSFKNKILNYYENKYNIKINKFTHYEYTAIIKKRTGKGKEIFFKEMKNFLRNTFKTSWIAYGYRKNEGLERLFELSRYENGIDNRNKMLYPVANWSEKDIYHYLKINKIPLTVEYTFGFHNLDMPIGETLDWMYKNYPADYELAIKQCPFLEGDHLRWKMLQT